MGWVKPSSAHSKARTHIEKLELDLCPLVVQTVDDLAHGAVAHDGGPIRRPLRPEKKQGTRGGYFAYEVPAEG